MKIAAGVVGLLVLAGVAWAAPPAPLPRGRAVPRVRPTHVVVRPTELDQRGASARVAPGVAVAVAGTRRVLPARGSVAVTLAGTSALAGRLPAAALGVRVLREVELRDARGVVGKAHAGALVSLVAERAGIATVQPLPPLAGRFTVPSDALGAADAELVMPVPEGRLATVRARTPLRPVGIVLLPGARVDVLGKVPVGGDAHVRTYGGVELEGAIPAAVLGDDAPPPELPASPLRPTHEALVDVPVYGDAAGKRPAGTLRGGTLVTVGIDVSGPLVRVMTHGSVIAELWAPSADLRPLDPAIWNERP